MATAVSLDPRYTGPLIIESYLKKLKKAGNRAIFSSKFTKRWFVLDLRSGSFHYLASKNKSKPEKAYTLSEIINVDINPKVTEVCDWKFSFVVETTDRSYFLYAESVSMHTLWCTALLALEKVPVSSPELQQGRTGGNYRDYDRDMDAAHYPQDDSEPRQPQEYDPSARTPSPAEEEPGQGRQAEAEAEAEAERGEAQRWEEQRRQEQREEEQRLVQQVEVREEQKQEPVQQPVAETKIQVVETIPQGTFVRVYENTEKTAAVKRTMQASAEQESEEFVVTNPSRFSDHRKGPVIGESSYKGSEKDSIWGQKSSSTDSDGVIKVEKYTSESSSKEEAKSIKRERIVKREEKPKPQEDPKPRPEYKAKPKPSEPLPQQPLPAAAFKESLNLGKGGFHDILDEMNSLSEPPEDLEKQRALWGGKQSKGKEKRTEEPPPQVVKQPPAGLGYEPGYRQPPPQAQSQAFDPPSLPQSEAAYGRQAVPPPSYEPQPAYSRQAVPPPSYEPPPAYTRQAVPPPSYEPQPAYSRQAVPPPSYEPQPAYSRQAVPPPSYEPQPVYSRQAVPPPSYEPQPAYSRQQPPPAAYEPQPAYGRQQPQGYEPQPGYGRQQPAPPAYDPQPGYPRQAVVPPSSFDPPPAYVETPVYKPRPKQPTHYVGIIHSEKTEVQTDAQRYDNWDEEDEQPAVAPSGSKQQHHQGQKGHPGGKAGLNWDDWDAE